MMSQAWAMTQGEVLYKDIFQIHPPLNFVYFVPFFWALEPSQVPHAVKAVNLLLVALTALLVYGFCALWLGDRAIGMVAGTSFLFMTSNRFVWTQSSHGEFLMILPLALSLCLLLLPRGTRLSWFGVGGLWAVAFLLKQVAIVDCLFLLGVVVIRYRKEAALLLRGLSATLVGFATVVGVAAIWLSLEGALPAAMNNLYLRTVVNYVGGSEPSWSHKPFYGLFVELPVFSVAAAVSGISMVLRRSVDRRTRAAGIGSAVWVVAVLGVLGSAGRFYHHYLLQVLLPFAVTACLVLSLLKGRARRGAAAAAVVAMVGTMTVSTWSSLGELSGRGWRGEEVRRASKVAEVLREQTAPGERIFLYRVPDLNVFYLAERRSSNGIYMYFDMTAEHMHDSRLAEEMQQRLLQRPPRAIVASDSMGRAFESNESFFWPLLERCYELTRSVGEVDVYLRKEDETGSGAGTSCALESP